jgi:hypothetical protein
VEGNALPAPEPARRHRDVHRRDDLLGARHRAPHGGADRDPHSHRDDLRLARDGRRRAGPGEGAARRGRSGAVPARPGGPVVASAVRPLQGSGHVSRARLPPAVAADRHLHLHRRPDPVGDRHRARDVALVRLGVARAHLPDRQRPRSLAHRRHAVGLHARRPPGRARHPRDPVGGPEGWRWRVDRWCAACSEPT